MTKTLKGKKSVHPTKERRIAGRRLTLATHKALNQIEADVRVGPDVTVTVRAPSTHDLAGALEAALTAALKFENTKEAHTAAEEEHARRRAKWNDKEVEFRKKMISRLDTIKSTDVGKILYPTSKETRSSVSKRRENGELIGLKTGRDYHYPRFQFDEEQHRIREVVAYANTTMGADTDPWGVADWWETPSTVLNEQTPLEALTAGELDRTAVDRIWKYEME